MHIPPPPPPLFFLLLSFRQLFISSHCFFLLLLFCLPPIRLRFVFVVVRPYSPSCFFGFRPPFGCSTTARGAAGAALNRHVGIVFLSWACTVLLHSVSCSLSTSGYGSIYLHCYCISYWYIRTKYIYIYIYSSHNAGIMSSSFQARVLP